MIIALQISVKPTVFDGGNLSSSIQLVCTMSLKR